ncbi:MAG: RDD family protein [Deltaproteobacteria bacterium]|nr:RDD family protein [Deltaproteobacteria bacterium]
MEAIEPGSLPAKTDATVRPRRRRQKETAPTMSVESATTEVVPPDMSAATAASAEMPSAVVSAEFNSPPTLDNPPVTARATPETALAFQQEIRPEVPLDELSFSRFARPEPELAGVDLRAPAPLPEQIASGQKNAEIVARGYDAGSISTKYSPATSEPLLTVAPVETESSEKLLSSDVGETSFHPAPAREAPAPIALPKPAPVIAVPELARPELKTPKIEPLKVALPRPKPLSGERLPRLFPAASPEAFPSSQLEAVVENDPSEYVFDQSSPMLAGTVYLDRSDAEDTFTRIVNTVEPERTPPDAGACTEQVIPKAVSESGAIPAVTETCTTNTNDSEDNIEDISNDLAVQVASEPVADHSFLTGDSLPITTADIDRPLPEILRLGVVDDNRENDEWPEARVEQPGTERSSGNNNIFTPPVDSHPSEIQPAASIRHAEPALAPPDSSGPQAVYYAQPEELPTNLSNSVSLPSWTPPEKRIEQIFSEMDDMSQKFDAPVVPNPEPIVPFNDGRFPDAMGLDFSQADEPGSSVTGKTLVSARSPDHSRFDQISFKLGQSGNQEITPESQLESADILGTGTGIGIRLDTPPGIGLTGKLDNYPAMAARSRLKDRLPSLGSLSNLKPRLTLPRKLLIKRSIAYLIDTVITLVALAMFVVAADWFTGAEFSVLHNPGEWIARTWWVLLILKTLIEGIFYVGLVTLVGQTPGDMLMKLKIVSRDGADASPALVIRRYFWLWPFNLIICWGALPLIIGGSETAHDRRAGTRVVEVV